MGYTNSPLVKYTKLSPNHSGLRNHKIDRITPHCVVGQCSLETLGNIFAPTSREASCNYGIATNGDIGMYVEEKNRSWCSSSNANDQRAITIECASDDFPPYTMTDAVYKSLIRLCVDVCKRNDIKKLLWLGGKDNTLAYTPKNGEAVLSAHRWFANKSCPGDWLYSRYGDLAAQVTKQLSGKVHSAPAPTAKLYRVQTGAFSKKSNADAHLAKVKAAGFGTYMVKINGLYKIQVGAYKNRHSAENIKNKLKTKGFDAFITAGAGAPIRAAIRKTDAEIADEIVKGTCSDPRWPVWGNGSTRVSRLKQAGYDPNAVQSIINKIL